jgi:hypothetical protein
VSRSSRKNALATHKAAGTYVPRLKTRPCFYDAQSIRDNQRDEVLELSHRLAAQRDRLNDRGWAFREASDVSMPLLLMTGLNHAVTE